MPDPTGRLRGPGVVHQEKFQRLDETELNEIVQQYDDPKLHLGLNDDWRKTSRKHYLNWFYRDWMGRFKPASGESSFFRWLKKSGFIDGQRA